MTATGTAIIQKAQYVRVGPFPMISGVIVKSGEKFRLDPGYKLTPLPFFAFIDMLFSYFISDINEYADFFNLFILHHLLELECYVNAF